MIKLNSKTKVIVISMKTAIKYSLHIQKYQDNSQSIIS